MTYECHMSKYEGHANDIRMTCKIILNYIAFEAFISQFSISFVVRPLLYVVTNDFCY